MNKKILSMLLDSVAGHLRTGLENETKDPMMTVQELHVVVRTQLCALEHLAKELRKVKS